MSGDSTVPGVEQEEVFRCEICNSDSHDAIACDPLPTRGRATLDANTVYRISSWLHDVGFVDAGEAVLGLISEFSPTCTKPCCTQDRDV